MEGALLTAVYEDGTCTSIGSAIASEKAYARLHGALTWIERMELDNAGGIAAECLNRGTEGCNYTETRNPLKCPNCKKVRMPRSQLATLAASC